MEKIAEEKNMVLYQGKFSALCLAKPRKLSLNKLVEMTLRQGMGFIPVSYEDKKVVSWFTDTEIEINTGSKKVFFAFAVTNVVYADLEKEVDYLVIDSDGKLILTNENVKGGVSLLLVENRTEIMKKILEQIREIEKEESP